MNIPPPLLTVTALDIHLRIVAVLLSQDFEIENKKLRETLNEYNTEFAEVKNQGIYIATVTMIGSRLGNTIELICRFHFQR